MALEVGSGSKVVSIDCGIHAREWVSPAYCQWFIREVTTGQFASYKNDIKFLIQPLLNPDGYAYTWTGSRMWRKNRVNNQGSNCIGVDLNRWVWPQMTSSDLWSRQAFHLLQNESHKAYEKLRPTFDGDIRILRNRSIMKQTDSFSLIFWSCHPKETFQNGLGSIFRKSIFHHRKPMYRSLWLTTIDI